jgi:hypothetical protein
MIEGTNKPPRDEPHEDGKARELPPGVVISARRDGRSAEQMWIVAQAKHDRANHRLPGDRLIVHKTFAHNTCPPWSSVPNDDHHGTALITLLPRFFLVDAGITLSSKAKQISPLNRIGYPSNVKIGREAVLCLKTATSQIQKACKVRAAGRRRRVAAINSGGAIASRRHAAPEGEGRPVGGDVSPVLTVAATERKGHRVRDCSCATEDFRCTMPLSHLTTPAYPWDTMLSHSDAVA